MTLPENEDSRSDSPPPKRVKLNETSAASTSNEISLLSFSDDLMLEILSFVRPTDLLVLSQCCQRLQRIACDRTLWDVVDLRCTCLVDRELGKYVKFLLPSTKLFATKGTWIVPDRSVEPAADDEPTITSELIENIAKAAPNLTTLILENHIIDSQDFTWEKLPPRLEHLSLRCCHIIKLDTNKSFFFQMEKYLPKLKRLDLSNCRWFQSHSFLTLSKCKHLEELLLADCLLSDFVPYVSLGTRFGFKALTVVDFRRTWVSDREVSCLNKTPTLRELYLESPNGERGAAMITDRAVTAFGSTLEDWNQMGYIVVLMPSYFGGFLPSPLQVLEMCNYTTVTDTSLRHCASCMKALKRLNVRGTSCTQGGILEFKSQRPNVVIESDFDLEVNTESSSSGDKTLEVNAKSCSSEDNT